MLPDSFKYVLQRNIEALSLNHICRGKAVNITYSECVSVALGVQHVMGMRHIMLSSVVGPARPHFAALSHKRHDFRGKKGIEHKIRVVIYSTTFV